MMKIKEVASADAMAMLEKGALLVDVREAREISGRSFDVADVMEMPLSDFGKRYQEIPRDRNVILACRSGNRSMMAARFLAENGFSRVFNLEDGIFSWERAGLPTKKAAQAGLIGRFMPGFLREA
jgi:rhodanese-related sulfurtransferase